MFYSVPKFHLLGPIPLSHHATSILTCMYMVGSNPALSLCVYTCNCMCVSPPVVLYCLGYMVGDITIPFLEQAVCASCYYLHNLPGPFPARPLSFRRYFVLKLCRVSRLQLTIGIFAWDWQYHCPFNHLTNTYMYTGQEDRQNSVYSIPCVPLTSPPPHYFVLKTSPCVSPPINHP